MQVCASTLRVVGIFEIENGGYESLSGRFPETTLALHRGLAGQERPDDVGVDVGADLDALDVLVELNTRRVPERLRGDLGYDSFELTSGEQARLEFVGFEMRHAGDVRSSWDDLLEVRAGHFQDLDLLNDMPEDSDGLVARYSVVAGSVILTLGEEVRAVEAGRSRVPKDTLLLRRGLLDVAMDRLGRRPLSANEHVELARYHITGAIRQLQALEGMEEF